ALRVLPESEGGETHLFEVDLWSDVVIDRVPECSYHRVRASVGIVDGDFDGVVATQGRNHHLRHQTPPVHCSLVRLQGGRRGLCPLLHDTQAPAKEAAFIKMFGKLKGVAK
ncbi:hypothetical protein CEXT_735711, partial [Caerostris extrusa]